MLQTLAVLEGSYKDIVQFFIQRKFQGEFLRDVSYTPEEEEPRLAKIMTDLTAQAVLTEKEEELKAIISIWQCYHPEGGDTYVSGLMDAGIFSRNLDKFNPAWTGFLKNVPGGAQQFTRSFGFAYVTQANQVAGCSVLYFPGAPDLWMLFNIIHPAAGEAKMTVVMPAMLFPEEVFRGNRNAVLKTPGLKIRFHADDSTEFPWNSFLANPKVSSVVSLLLEGHYCSPDRISLLSDDNPNAAFSWPHQVWRGGQYYHLPTAIKFLSVLSRAPAQIDTALKNIRSNTVLIDCIDTFLKSFEEWEGKILHKVDRDALAELFVLCSELRYGYLGKDQVARLCLFLCGQYYKWVALIPTMADLDYLQEFNIEALSPENREILSSKLGDAAQASEAFNRPSERDRNSLFKEIDGLYQNLPKTFETPEDVSKFRTKLLEYLEPYIAHMKYVFKTRGGSGELKLETMSREEVKGLLFPTSQAPASGTRVSMSALPKADRGDIQGTPSKLFQKKPQEQWRDLRHLSRDDLTSLAQMLKEVEVNIEIPLTTLNLARHHLLKYLRRSLPWVLVQRFEDDALEIQRGSGINPPCLLPTGLYRDQVRAYLKANKAFNAALTRLDRHVSFFSASNVYVKTMAHAFYQYCQTSIDDKTTGPGADHALAMLISQYANWRLMTDDIEYPEEIQQAVMHLLVCLKSALPNFQEEKLPNTDLTVLVPRQSAPVGPAATFPEPTKPNSAAVATPSFPAP